MSRKRWVALAVGGTMALALGGKAALHRLRPGEKGGASAEKAPREGVSISSQAAAKNAIATAKVALVKMEPDIQVVGSVSYDHDHYAVVGPLVPGRVVRLRAGVGDRVRVGQMMAEIESAEVGQAQAAYLSARARTEAAEANLHRERELATQRISSAREREVAEAQAASETAEVRAAVERLRAFGLAPDEIEAIGRGGGTGGRVALRAPLAGTVVWRSLTLGQAVERATDAFKIVDLSHLWVLLDLYEKDLNYVHVGQKVEIRTEAHPGEVFHAHVAYINPLIDEKTRTANVRIELGNPGGKLRPGLFVTARLVGDKSHAPAEVLAVSRQAVQTVEGRKIVFVRTPRGFERRVIELGFSSGEMAEVRSGVTAGEEVATDGAFLLKSELLR